MNRYLCSNNRGFTCGSRCSLCARVPNAADFVLRIRGLLMSSFAQVSASDWWSSGSFLAGCCLTAVLSFAWISILRFRRRSWTRSDSVGRDAWFRHSFEGSPIGLYLAAADGRVVSANREPRYRWSAANPWSIFFSGKRSPIQKVPLGTQRGEPPPNTHGSCRTVRCHHSRKHSARVRW